MKGGRSRVETSIAGDNLEKLCSLLTMEEFREDLKCAAVRGVQKAVQVGGEYIIEALARHAPSGIGLQNLQTAAGGGELPGSVAAHINTEIQLMAWKVEGAERAPRSLAAAADVLREIQDMARLILTNTTTEAAMQSITERIATEEAQMKEVEAINDILGRGVLYGDFAQRLVDERSRFKSGQPLISAKECMRYWAAYKEQIEILHQLLTDEKSAKIGVQRLAGVMNWTDPPEEDGPEGYCRIMQDFMRTMKPFIYLNIIDGNTNDPALVGAYEVARRKRNSQRVDDNTRIRLITHLTEAGIRPEDVRLPPEANVIAEWEYFNPLRGVSRSVGITTMRPLSRRNKTIMRDLQNIIDTANTIEGGSIPKIQIGGIENYIALSQQYRLLQQQAGADPELSQLCGEPRSILAMLDEPTRMAFRRDRRAWVLEEDRTTDFAIAFKPRYI